MKAMANDRFTFKKEGWISEELERRKQLFTDLFDGKPLTHIPIEIKITRPQYPMRDYYDSRDKQLEDSMNAARMTWALKEKNDMIPALSPDIGCSGLATAFGGEYFFGDNEMQTAGIKYPPVTEPEKQIPGIETPDLMDSKWLREGVERVRAFAEAGDGLLPVNGLDIAGGLNVVSDLIGLQDMLMRMVTSPELIHQLLKLVQQAYLDLIAMETEAAGGLDNFATIDFFFGWCPPGFKGHCSDDISAMIRPKMYDEFSGPYHAMIYEKYGCGGLHNCGPNPCQESYVSQKLSPIYLDLAERFSQQDLPKMKHSLKKKAFIRWCSEMTDTKEIVECYRQNMELLAPDVILVPIYTLDSVEQGEELYDALYPISVEYARRMDFGFDLR